jgi:hypothetical protein
VKAGLARRRFTIRTAPGLIKSAMVWPGYCDGQRSLEQAIRRRAKKTKRAAGYAEFTRTMPCLSFMRNEHELHMF